MIIVNGILLKYYSNDKSIVLPDSVTAILGSTFKKNIESIHGEKVRKIYGKLELDNLKKLYLPNLDSADSIDCPNLIKLTVNENFHCKKPIITPAAIGTFNRVATYSNEPRELLEYINKMYNLSIYRKNSNVIYINNGEIKYTYGDDNNIINSVIYLIKLLNMIPNNIREIIENSGYKIFITNTYFKDENSFLAGITYNRLKLCVLSEMSLLELIHEFGHIYDSVMDVSSSDEFIEMYKLEKNRITSNNSQNNISLSHIRSSNREFFAESFKKYIIDKDEFYKECPLTKSFLDIEFNKSDKVKKK